jgi:hypothetical protein
MLVSAASMRLFGTKAFAGLFALSCVACVACAEAESDPRAWSGPGDELTSTTSGGGPGEGGAGGAGQGSGGGGGSGGSGGGGEDVQKQYIYACSDIYLYRIDTDTLGPNVVVEKVGEFGAVPDRMIDIAVTPGGKVYTMSWNEGASPNKLWEINPDTAEPKFIAEVPGSGNVALTFDADEALVGADKGGRVFRIDLTTGDTTDIGEMGFGSAGDIVGVSDGTLYGFTDSGGSSSEAINSLVTIDRTTGAATEVGLTGFANLWGAAFWCGKVYAFGADGDLLEIDVKTGKGTMLASKIPVAKSGFSGAGVTPMAPPGTASGFCD